MAPITLDSFAVTKNAFLPDEPPLACLPGTYYRPWETIAQNLPVLIRHRELRNEVKQLPLLNTDRLIIESEWRRAYVALSYIAHAYIWGGETPEEILPPQISIPLLAVSAHVELPPVLTCAAVNIWNYTLPDPSSSATDPDALSIPTTFTGTESEAWFQKIGTAIEAQGGSVIEALLSAFHAVRPCSSSSSSHTGSTEPITAALVQLRTCLADITRTLERMHERCDPLTFCHQIRPFYAGSKNLQAAGLPRGVFYSSDARGGGEWLQLPGGSNGQSALIQLFDVVLGLGFGGGCSRHDDYYFSTRACTPGPHRRFLAWAAHAGSIRRLALREGVDTKEQERLRAAFVGAADALSAFRTKHIQIVTRYIAMPLKRSWEGSVQSRSLPLLLPSGLGDDGNKGTAGTTMLEFLKSLRNETANTARLAAE